MQQNSMGHPRSIPIHRRDFLPSHTDCARPPAGVVLVVVVYLVEFVVLLMVSGIPEQRFESSRQQGEQRPPEWTIELATSSSAR